MPSTDDVSDDDAVSDDVTGEQAESPDDVKQEQVQDDFLSTFHVDTHRRVKPLAFIFLLYLIFDGF